MKSQPCRRYAEAMAISAVQDCPAEQQPEIAHHLLHCAECRAYRQELEDLHATLGRLGSWLPSAEPSPAARARWHQAIIQCKSGASRSESPARGPAPLLSNLWHGAKAVTELACRRPGLACLSLAWALILFFNSSSRNLAVPHEPAFAASPRELFLVLRAVPMLISEPSAPADSPGMKIDPRTKSRSSRPEAVMSATV